MAIVSRKQLPLWRSMLFVPTNVKKFVESAPTRGADAYFLDLKDSIPISEKRTRGAWCTKPPPGWGVRAPMFWSASTRPGVCQFAI
mgnify:CR=1 FL=1